MKYLFKNDYSELAHPRILEAFARLGQTQQNGYSEDGISLETAGMLKETLASPGAIYFLGFTFGDNPDFKATAFSNFNNLVLFEPQ